MNRFLYFIIFGMLFGFHGCRKPESLVDKINIRIDRVYSNQYPDKYYPLGESFMGFLFLDITIENHSDSVVRIFMREYPEDPNIPSRHPSRLNGAYGIYQGDTLEMEAHRILNIPPHSFETRQFMYGNDWLEYLYNRGNYSTIPNFMETLFRNSHFYFVINERYVRKLEPSPDLNINFLGRPNADGEWIHIVPLRKGILHDKQ